MLAQDATVRCAGLQISCHVFQLSPEKGVATWSVDGNEMLT